MLSLIIRNDIACLCHARQSRVIGWLGMHLITRRLRLTAASDSVYCSVNEIFLVPVQDRIKKKVDQKERVKKERAVEDSIHNRREGAIGSNCRDAELVRITLSGGVKARGLETRRRCRHHCHRFRMLVGDRPRTLARGDSTCNNNIFFSLSLSRSAPCGVWVCYPNAMVQPLLTLPKLLFSSL